MIKATPIYNGEVILTVSYDVTDAWEVWDIIVSDPPTNEPITSSWLEANPDKWDYHDFRDRGGDTLANLNIENVD